MRDSASSAATAVLCGGISAGKSVIGSDAAASLSCSLLSLSFFVALMAWHLPMSMSGGSFPETCASVVFVLFLCVFARFLCMSGERMRNIAWVAGKFFNEQRESPMARETSVRPTSHPSRTQGICPALPWIVPQRGVLAAGVWVAGRDRE